MRFALTLVPCPECGTPETARPSLHGDLTFRPIFRWTCPGCGVERSYRFRIWPVLPDRDSSPPGHLGGDEPSRLIAPDALAAEARRLAPLVPTAPETLDPDAWRAAWDLMWRRRTCLIELAKFPGRDLTAEREQAEALHERYRADAPRNNARHRAMYPPKPEPRGNLDRFVAGGHGAWVRRGCTGPGRVDIAHVDAKNLYLGAQNLRLSRFEEVTFEGANAEYSTFEQAVWTRVHARGARLASTTWEQGELVECDLRGSDLRLGKLDRVVVTGGDWDRVKFDRATLRHAWFEGVSLRDAVLHDARLDGAMFLECDVRGADVRATDHLLGLSTHQGTRFVRCDLRDTRWDGRRGLDAAEFVDCLQV
jgi:hypothetical protein